ncbi:hypothetical protein BKG95_01075 [Rodentibacter pneumotropicus]|uniref:Uncharacterized protein n=1 Tax=Rodentibacter pneumotropicus TaxID=758 RepID=A0AAW5LAH1_9PAST|nr:hypothetical protein [Rodentibacter pneumotropicus]MCQ9120704.1 hypothetical protein [Rodentibacter pneumotropicus]OOF68887.1 hypothetical protein BKG95_01075 [Rodentibacter pneumotropicus]
MVSFDEVKNFISKKPLIICEITRYENYLSEDNFSFPISNDGRKIFRGNNIIIVKSDPDFYLAIGNSKCGDNYETVTIKYSYPLNVAGLDDELKDLENRNLKNLKKGLEENKLFKTTKSSSLKILEKLWGSNNELFQKIFKKIAKRPSIQRILENDAVKFLLGVADITSNFTLKNLSYKTEHEPIKNTLDNMYLLEDKIVEFDVYDIREGIELNSKVAGKATFENEHEKFTIYSANKTDIETELGVDIIYINEISSNIVMVQYKMIEKLDQDEKWEYKCDTQFEKQIIDMANIFRMLTKDNDKEFRLNYNPFYFRFIKRNLSLDEGKINSYVLPLEHCLKILKNNEYNKFIFDRNSHSYLGKSELENLMRAGYIGSYSSDTQTLQKIIDIINNNEKSHPLFIAFKENLEKI